MTGWMVLRFHCEGIAGPLRADFADPETGRVGACFVYETEAQAIEAADGCGVVAVDIPGWPS